MENLHIKLYMGKEKVLDQKPTEWVELPTLSIKPGGPSQCDYDSPPRQMAPSDLGGDPAPYNGLVLAK